jgi:c-di-GMP-binding flagellar brake protein YcgR
MSAALTDDEIDDRFYLLGQRHIIATLGQFIYQSIPVTALFNGGNDFILTTLLEARPAALVFDLGGNPQANQRLLKSASCTYVSSVNGIRVQFSTSGGIRRIRWGDADAFAVSLPKRVLRLQRREAYRITTPMIKAITVRLHGGQLDVDQNELKPIHDISVSGFAAIFSLQPNLEPGQSFERVTLTLPKRFIDSAIVVRHVTASEGVSGHRNYRVGMAFTNLPRSMEIEIQRYIIALEHARHNLALE